MHFLCVKKTFKAMVIQMCGAYSKTKSETLKHCQQDHIIFLNFNYRSSDFKPSLEIAKPTSVNSSVDKQKAPIRNVSSQPFTQYLAEKKPYICLVLTGI